MKKQSSEDKLKQKGNDQNSIQHLTQQVKGSQLKDNDQDNQQLENIMGKVMQEEPKNDGDKKQTDKARMSYNDLMEDGMLNIREFALYAVCIHIFG